MSDIVALGFHRVFVASLSMKPQRVGRAKFKFHEIEMKVDELLIKFDRMTKMSKPAIESLP